MIVGIDLGTTMSAIARVNAMGKVEIVTNDQGEQIVPSVVLFSEDGTPTVGTSAKNQAVSFPDMIVEFVKNDIGTSKRYHIANKQYSPEEISSFILKYLKSQIETKLGETVDRAVITVPAIFGENERHATRVAGQLAGLEVLAILDEPVAAALYYGLGRPTVDNRAENVLVYDLGGGTFDLTVITVQGNRLTVLSTTGNRRLGGKDWDDRIIEHVAKAFQATHGFDPREELETLQDLRDRCERAKKTLSVMDKTVINCGARGRSHRVQLTLSQFDSLTEDLLAQTRTVTELEIENLQKERQTS